MRIAWDPLPHGGLDGLPGQGVVHATYNQTAVQGVRTAPKTVGGQILEGIPHRPLELAGETLGQDLSLEFAQVLRQEVLPAQVLRFHRVQVDQDQLDVGG